MKRFLVTLVSIVIILAFVLGIAGCVSSPGSTGATGATGTQGLQGRQGEKGDTGVAGVSIVGALVNDVGHLILMLSNGQTIDAGYVRGDETVVGSSAVIHVSNYLHGGYYPPQTGDDGIPYIGKGDLVIISGAGFLAGEFITFYTDAGTDGFLREIGSTSILGNRGNFRWETYADWVWVSWPTDPNSGSGVFSIKAVGDRGSEAVAIMWLQGR